MAKEINTNDKGNALFLILIAVALFAALGYAVTKSSRSGSGSIDREQASLIANEMLGYGDQLRQAIHRLVLVGGCKITEISFENSNYTDDYSNPNAPLNNRCHIFKNAGGGIPWQFAPRMTGAAGLYGMYKYVTGGASFSLRHIGTDLQHDLYLRISQPSPNAVLIEACKEINNRFEITDVPGNIADAPAFASNSWSGVLYQGVFLTPPNAYTHNEFNDSRVFCAQAPGNQLAFIYTLYER